MKILIVLAFLFSITEAIAQGLTSKDKIRVGDSAINFSAQNESGEMLQLSDFEGKYVLLDFTHIACGPCWQSYPHLSEIQNKYKEELEVVTFHIDDYRERWIQMAISRNIDVNWLTLWEIENKDQKMKEYQINGFPYYFLIDKEGVIVEKIFGYNKSKINRHLKKHLE